MCVSFCKFKLTNLKLNLKNHFYSHSLIIKIFNKKKRKEKEKQCTITIFSLGSY